MSLKHSLTRIVALTATLLVACGDENFAYSVRCIKD